MCTTYTARLYTIYMHVTCTCAYTYIYLCIFTYIYIYIYIYNRDNNNINVSYILTYFTYFWRIFVGPRLAISPLSIITFRI